MRDERTPVMNRYIHTPSNARGWYAVPTVSGFSVQIYPQLIPNGRVQLIHEGPDETSRMVLSNHLVQRRWQDPGLYSVATAQRHRASPYLKIGQASTLRDTTQPDARTRETVLRQTRQYAPTPTGRQPPL